MTAWALGLAACAPGAPQRPEPGSLDEVAAELQAMAGAAIRAHPETFRDILEDAIAKDAYACLPSPRELFESAPDGERVITGAMPHYGLYFGPMQYVVRRTAGRFTVSVRIAVTPPRAGATLELPDCALAPVLEGRVVCRGAPYSQAPGTDACPASGLFTAPATPRNVHALLGRWSRDAERYYDRDAEAFGIPVDYDFEIVLAAHARARSLRVDMEAPLATTCGRTPYFSALRSGWSLPVVAHEIGHVMGLLDEYEAFSGIVGFYPKTPFPGAEVSRMGLSMKESTRVLPLHHYLVLRRYVCPEPRSRDPYGHAVR